MPHVYRKQSDKPKNSPAVIALTIIAGIVLCGLIIGLVIQINDTNKAGSQLIQTQKNEYNLRDDYGKFQPK